MKLNLETEPTMTAPLNSFSEPESNTTHGAVQA